MQSTCEIHSQVKPERQQRLNKRVLVWVQWLTSTIKRKHLSLIIRFSNMQYRLLFCFVHLHKGVIPQRSKGVIFSGYISYGYPNYTFQGPDFQVPGEPFSDPLRRKSRSVSTKRELILPSVLKLSLRFDLQKNFT